MIAETAKAQDICAVPLGDGRFHAQYLISAVDNLGADVLRVRLVKDRLNRPQVYGSQMAAEAAAGRAAFADMRGEQRNPPAKGKIVAFERGAGMRVRRQIGVIR